MAAANVLSGTRLLDQRYEASIRKDRQRHGHSSARSKISQAGDHRSAHRLEATRAPLVLDTSSVDIAGYRNTYKHNVCVDMLKDGFHESFRELWSLIERQKAEREAAGKESGFYYDPYIEDEEEKLDRFKMHLTDAEDAKRRGDLNNVYDSLHSLAEYFDEMGDNWLADHFYQRCLETSLEIRDDGRRKEGEAHCNMGLSQENKGRYEEAAKHFEHFYALAELNEGWYTSGGQSLRSLAADSVRRIYTTIAEENSEIRESIEYLKKAYEMAKEVDSEAEALASYRLGNAYEEANESETAIKHQKTYLEKCKVNKDDVGIGLACQALARSYETLGDLENAVRFLEMFVEVAGKTGQEEQVYKACSSLGAMYNTLGQFDKAVTQFSKSYDLARRLNESLLLSACRVRYGIVSAHNIYARFSQAITASQTANLLGWKNRREQDQDQYDSEAPNSQQEESEEGKSETETANDDD